MLGEGQYFGQHPKSNDGASVRSVQRPETAQMNRGRSPYAKDTHNLAASSMYNLASASHGREGSYSSLKPYASEANMRGRFGANNGSSVSLAVPAPAFGSKYRGNNGSSSSLAAPGPGFSSRLAAKNGSSVSLALPSVTVRPSTSNGRTKEWVNPLDVHFARPVPSGPTTPRSPLSQSDLRLPPTPKEESDSGSIFGAEADDVVDSIIEAVKINEKLADEKEREARRQRETARLEKERLERQRAAEAKLAANPAPPSQLNPRPQPRPLAPPQLQPSPSSPVVESPIFRGTFEDRPGSRGGTVFQETAEDGPEARGGIQGNNGLTAPRPPAMSRGPDQRPDSRNGARGKGSGDSVGNQHRGPAIHQGPPRHGPPTHGLPRIPDGRRPPGGPGEESGGRGPRPAGVEPSGSGRPMGPNNGPSSGPANGPNNGPRNGSNNGPRNGPNNGPRPGGPGPVFRGPPPGPGGQRSQSPAPGLRINPHVGLRSQSPARHRRGHEQLTGCRSESPAPISPSSLEPGQIKPRPYSPAFGPGPSSLGGSESRSQSPIPSSLGPNAPRRQESGSTVSVKSPSAEEPTLRELMAQSPEPLASPGSPTSDDGGVVEQFARPIIQSVQARRDTLTLNSPRRHSLSMEIEELEKSLVRAQAQQAQMQAEEVPRTSMSSSHYSDESDAVSPTMTLQPAPLRASPPLMPRPNPSLAARREQSPMRSVPPTLRRGPRRPTLDEYGVPTSQLSNSAYRSELRNGSISPLSRSTTPQFQQPQPIDTAPASVQPFDLPSPPFRRQRQTPSTVIEPGFKFDFGPTTAAPPTPDSTTWPLAQSPISPVLDSDRYTQEPAEQEDHHPDSDGDSDDASSSSQPENKEAESAAAALNRANIPPPLSFNFSPDAYSRDPGLWTPPLRSRSKDEAVLDLHPSISNDTQSSREEEEVAAALGIGVARGLSVRDPKRRAGPAPPMPMPMAPAGSGSRTTSRQTGRTGGGGGMVDEFGTGFI
ncbi:hypothetical protein QBC47DRAFT_375445 [Echria macrotheca]|uniref:Uncharacterized protein n=1 Tax=Echria macrotheca TaxID=438768 RepID=A0AAJ0BK41_9PEZI|nr:hypothetical protein QBC47DRAFT_375445 [Echria macrotheca]